MLFTVLKPFSTAAQRFIPGQDIAEHEILPPLTAEHLLREGHIAEKDEPEPKPELTADPELAADREPELEPAPEDHLGERPD